MENFYPRPEPYIPLYRIHKNNTSDLRITTPKVLSRRYSGDRVVAKRAGQYTIQQPRRETEKRERKSHFHQPSCEDPIDSANSFMSLHTPPANVNYFREWNPANEEFNFNIRPGRSMFPFIRDAMLQEDHLTDDDDCVRCAEPLTLPRGSKVWKFDQKPQFPIKKGALEFEF